MTPFDGDIDDYQSKLLRERGNGKSNGGKNAKGSKRERKVAPAPAPEPSPKKERKQSADTRTRRAPLKRTLETLEKSIARLNKQRSDIDAKLADPEIYSDPAINVAELQREKVGLEREIAHAEHEWLVAQEAYEAA